MGPARIMVFKIQWRPFWLALAQSTESLGWVACEIWPVCKGPIAVVKISVQIEQQSALENYTPTRPWPSHQTKVRLGLKFTLVWYLYSARSDLGFCVDIISCAPFWCLLEDFFICLRVYSYQYMSHLVRKPTQRQKIRFWVFSIEMFSFGQIITCWKQNQKIFWNDRVMAVWSHAIHRPSIQQPDFDSAYLNIATAGVRSVFSWSGSYHLLEENFCQKLTKITLLQSLT